MTLRRRATWLTDSAVALALTAGLTSPLNRPFSNGAARQPLGLKLGPLKLRDFLEIVGLSISVSLAATAVAAAISLPIGTALAIFPFRGRRFVIVLINAFFGLPPVVVGLVLYLALSHSGPLGFLALLFTPTAMVVAQTILAIPIVTALAHRASERAWARYGDKLTCDGATRFQAAPQILMV